LDLDLRHGFEWRGQSSLCGRRGKEREKGEKLFARAEEARGRERKGVMQTFQPHFITVECKLRNTNFEYLRADVYKYQPRVGNIKILKNPKKIL